MHMCDLTVWLRAEQTHTRWMGEHPIELSSLPQDARFAQMGDESLKQDVENAIRAANLSETQARKRNSATGSGVGTVNSSNSLMTGNSYVDFDHDIKRRPKAKNDLKSAAQKAQRAHKRMLAGSMQTTSQLFRPLKTLKRPLQMVAEWYRRRKQLPPSPDGRKVLAVVENDPATDHVDPPPGEDDSDKSVSKKRKSGGRGGRFSDFVNRGSSRAKKGSIDVRTGKPYVSNLITSSIYTVHDFIPRQLLAQFSKLANVYFLFVAILQMIPGWSTTGNYTTIVPLAVFVMISMGREGYEDWVRHRNDAEENNREVLVREGLTYRTTKWKDVRVGDVVRVLQNEWIPADIVLLHSSGPKGQCSIETLALDGESNLKGKEVPGPIQHAFRADGPGGAALITAEDPNLDLFNFEGTALVEKSDDESQVGQLIPLSNNNIIYRGCTLRNTASISGLVVYSGKETKMQMNASKGSRTKAPKLQGKVNKVVIALASLVILLSGILTAVSLHTQDKNKYWYIEGLSVSKTQSMMGFIIMLNTLIPISLYVSMEICKVFQTMLMKSDIDMYDEINDVRCNVQTSSLNEELGQVSYVFSDKTGTLTDNVMLFRKMSIGGYAWTHDLDLYLSEDSDYLFRQARPNTDMEVELLEQLAMLPRKSFGGRIGGLNNPPSRPSIGRPSLGRPSMGTRPSMGRPSMGYAPNRPSHQAQARGPPPPGRKSTTSIVPSPAPGRASTTSVGTFYTTASGGPPLQLSMPPPIPSLPHASTPRQSGFDTRKSLDESVASAAALGWQSAATPGRPQTTPSTLTLLEYMMTHPSSPYTERAKFFLLALSLCHSASPVIDLTEGATGEVEIEQLDYQASSPDELALVSAARDLGYLVVDRQTDSCTIRTYPKGLNSEPVDEVYKILDVIEFSSSRKRMSIVVEFPDGRIVVMCKGADNVMIERLQKQLLSVAHQKQDELREDTFVRRSLEARLANENQHFTKDMRPSLDMLLQRSSVEQNIQENARKSSQFHRKSMEARQTARSMDLHSNVRNSIHSAIADAKSTAEDNAMEARISLDRSTAMRSPPQSPVAPPGRSAFYSHGNNSRSSQAAAAAPPTGNNTTHGVNAITAAAQDYDLMDERQALTRTLEQIDEFSTEGLRTLLYGHKFMSREAYGKWKAEYDEARAAISNRQARLEEVGEKIEHDFEVTGASAIEDKLQRGVPESIEKLRRASIRMWMLTGDKRETAVNIGYSCRLIKDYSTVITLKVEDSLEEKLMAALDELDSQQIAHCVTVIDGQTLGVVEKDAILLSLFVDLGLKADSVIVCRASPAQKASIVRNVRKREPGKVMLAIGDGANDIAMIQAADVGIGIAGREGLQAARSSDFSIGQFRFLMKLLFVHGRWNYNRTCKYILATFYKEFFFYMSQVLYQRYVMFTGTSVFESWSISMFNTLFTSLPVISLGVLDQDLSPTSLIAVPELYNIGQKNRQFHFRALIMWQVVATLECLMAGFITYHIYGSNYLLKDNSIFPFGVVIYTIIVAVINLKTQLIIMMYYITMISILVIIISVGGYWLFNILIGLVYIIDGSKTYFAQREFWTQTGTELFYWAICLFGVMVAMMFELLIKMVWFIFWPSDVDQFQMLEKDPFIMRRLEAESELELSKGWEYQDKMPHKWSDLLRGKLPGQPRNTEKLHRQATTKKRAKDIIAEKLRLRKPVDEDQEIRDILARRQFEAEQHHAEQSTELSSQASSRGKHNESRYDETA